MNWVKKQENMQLNISSLLYDYLYLVACETTKKNIDWLEKTIKNNELAYKSHEIYYHNTLTYTTGGAHTKPSFGNITGEILRRRNVCAQSLSCIRSIGELQERPQCGLCSSMFGQLLTATSALINLTI